MLQKLQNIQIISFDKIYNGNNIVLNQEQNNTHNNTKNEQMKQFVEYLQQNIKNVKAIKYRLQKMRKKCMFAFQNYCQQSKKQRIIHYYFQLWKYQFLTKKIQNKIIKKKLFIRLRSLIEDKIKQNMNKVMQMAADNCYEKTLKLRIFIQWKQTIKVQKKVKQFQLYIKKSNFNTLKVKCDIRKNNRFTKQLADSIYKQKLLKKYFKQINQATKICKIQDKLYRRNSKIFIIKLKKYYTNQKLTYENYYKKKLTSVSFQKLKQNRQIQKYNKIYDKKLLKTYFNLWIKAGNILFYQKEQQMKNQEIVNQYLERKKKIKLLYYFQKWKAEIDQKIQNRKKNQIAKQYGQVKQKQFLLNKYFQAWQQLKLYNKTQKFYNTNLKNRIFVGLKKQLIKSAQKWDNLYKFVQNREKRKYFDAIKRFINNDITKTLNLRTKKVWDLFTFAITKNYIITTTKANNFHQQSLKFKTLFGFKDIIQLKNKINKTIIFINANMVLRRWNKGYRIRQFAQGRKFLLVGKLFRQMKLLRMNKLWSESNNKERKKQETQKKLGVFPQKYNTITQSSISFQKIYMQSPERMFNLDYSISAYNSNNNENF